MIGNIDGVTRELTAEEETEYNAIIANLPKVKTPEDRITELETENANLLECVLEMSEIVYA